MFYLRVSELCKRDALFGLIAIKRLLGGILRDTLFHYRFIYNCVNLLPLNSKIYLNFKSNLHIKNYYFS